MPKVGTDPPATRKRWLPISLLRPGQQFVMPPGGTVVGGTFQYMIGDDAKVISRDANGRESSVCWSGMTNVWPGDKIEALVQAPPKQPSATTIARSDERRTNVLNRKEIKAIVEKVSARPVAAPVVRRAMIGRKA